MGCMLNASYEVPHCAALPCALHTNPVQLSRFLWLKEPPLPTVSDEHRVF